MNIKKKIVSDSIFTLGRIIFTTVRGLIIIPLVTNFLGVGAYGVWTIVLTFVSLTSSFAGIHLHGSVIRFGSRDSQKEQTYSDVIFLAMIIAGITFIIIMLAGTVINISTVSSELIADQTTVIFASSSLIFMTILYKVNSNFFRSKSNVRTYDSIRIIKTVLESILLGIVFYFDGTVVAGILSLVLISLLLNVGLIGYIIYTYSIPRPNIDNYRKYIEYGMPMVPADVSSTLLASSDKYVIFFLLSPTAVGVYAVARSISAILTDITNILNPTLYPSISTAWDEQNFVAISSIYENIFRYYSILGIPAFFGIIFLSYSLLTVISTQEIAESGSFLVPILAFGFLMRGYDNPLGYILRASRDTKFIGRIWLFVAVINTVLNLLLVSLIGLTGAAVATALSYTVMFALIYWHASMRISFTLPFFTFGRCLSASIIMFGVLQIIDIDISPNLIIIVYPAFGLIIYTTALFILGEFKREDIDMVKNILFNK